MLHSLRKHQPAWLYEAMPFIYLVAGLLCLWSLRSVAGMVSGLLLLSAGGMVWKMRRDYRRMTRSGGRAMNITTMNGEPPPMSIVWRPSLCVGHPLIDEQHRKLFDLGNELIEALMSRRAPEVVEFMLDLLVDDINTHFETEESVFAETGRPLPEGHVRVHRALLERIREMRRRYRINDLPAGELIGFIAYDVIAEHVIKEDLKFAPQAN